MLTFVIPVSPADVHRLKSTVDAMEFLGGLQKHTVLFFPTPSVQGAVAEQASRIKAICPSAAVHTLPRDHDPVGPFGAFNAIFRDSVEELSKRNTNPWMWWELDTVPIRGGWADRLELEYHQKGQPFMGVRVPASKVMRNLEGKPLPDSDPRAQGDYMVAVGIYPPNFKDYSTMYKYPEPGGQMPTDVVIRHEVNRHLHHTPLIGHHWGTGNYRRNAQGQIECDDTNLKPNYPSYAGVVSEMAFVVHGVKDESLSKLILSEMPGNVTSIGTSTAAVGAHTSSSEAESLKAQIEEMQRDIQKMQEQWRQKENSYADEIEALKEKLGNPSHFASTPEAAVATMPQREVEIIEKPVPGLEAIKKALAEAKKSIQLANLAADFGCNKKALRDLLQTDPSIKIAPGGLAWVSLAA